MTYGSAASRSTDASTHEPLPSVRARLAHTPLRGTFQVLGHPAVTEVLALSGPDFVIADAEHAALGIETIEALVRAGDARGLDVLVRVAGIDASLSRTLDTGAAGIVVPRVESAADAAAVVRATRFPPLGARGLGPARACDFGLDLVSHRATANDELLVVIMVETAAGLAAVDEIAAVDGIDVILIGPADLASSLGVPAGSAEHSAAISTITAAARAAGRHVGIHCASASDADAFEVGGMRLLVIGTDVAFLASAAFAQFTSAPFNEERS